MNRDEHRKRLRRYNLPFQAREITFSTLNRLPVLADEAIARIVLESISTAVARSDFSLLAYVVMPEHVHLLMMPHRVIESPSPVRLLSDIKRRASYETKRLLQDRGDDSRLERLSVVTKDRRVFRLWLPGAGYDRNITNPETARASIEYIHNNPVKRGLCRRAEDYPWSSASQWLVPGGDVPEWVPRAQRTML